MAKAAMTEEILPGEALAPGSMLTVEGVSTEAGESDDAFPLDAPDPGTAGAAERPAAAAPTADSPTTGALQNVATFFYAWDHLGTVRLVSNQDRTMLDRHDYEPFGVELTPFTDQADLTHRFTGHERDLQTGYDYMHFRFYGSNMGRFLKPDSVVANAADPQSWNLYAYVRNNPANATDPTGHLSDIFLREIAASPSSDQGIGATRTADGTPPPAGQKEAEDLNRKNSGFWESLWDSVKQGFEVLWDKVLGTPSGKGSDRSYQIEELEEEGIVNAGEAGQTNIGTKANAELRDAAATVGAEGTKFVAAQAVLGGAGKILPILKPAGRWIGRTGSNKRVRVLSGGVEAAREMFATLSAEGKVIEAEGYPGVMVEIPGGGRIGLREASKSGPATIDIALPGVSIDKIRFPE